MADIAGGYPTSGDVEDVQADGLEVRAFVYRILQSLFGGEPNSEMLQLFQGETTTSALLSCGEGGGSLPEAEELVAVLRGISSDCVSALAHRYTKLFIGPDSLEAWPWESMYLSRDKVLFQQVTLDVRNAYRSAGFLPAQYPRVADDHVALECAFMAEMADRAAAAHRAGDAVACRRFLVQSSEFAREHLLKWLPSYAADLRRTDEDGLYGVTASFASRFVEEDVKAIDAWPF